jgi:hypothetical protein
VRIIFSGGAIASGIRTPMPVKTRKPICEGYQKSERSSQIKELAYVPLPTAV